MKRPVRNLAASVRQRLLNESRAQQVDPNYLLTRFALERFLYRLGQSSYVDRFVLKGALLLEVWLGQAGRMTRDLDLLGFGDLSADALRHIFAAICEQPVEPDGVRFDPESVEVGPIREEDEYGGRRLTLMGYLGSARLPVRIDVGIGDQPTPAAEWLDYPVLLDLPPPHLRAYRPETTIAEKLHAMVVLDLQNSRMKDFFDVYRLAQECAFSGDTLVTAVVETFNRRQTDIPSRPITALSQAFAEDPAKIVQWNAFLTRNTRLTGPPEFAAVIELIAVFLEPVVDAARQQQRFSMSWAPGGPWGVGEQQAEDSEER